MASPPDPAPATSSRGVVTTAPTVEGSIYRWQVGEAVLEVDAAVGARVTAFRIGDDNILIGPEVDPLNYGSTFWTSPQADWRWPPVLEIDSDPYHVEGSPGVPVFVSRPGPPLGIAVSKRVDVDGRREAVAITYRLINRSDVTQKAAPWEISRVAAGGLTFFPLGEGVFAPSNLSVRQIDGVIWFAYDPEPITDHQKVFADGREGWIAHVDPTRKLILVKAYPPVGRAEQAPGEAQIEVYANPQHTYVEVEEQGRYEALPPGGEVSFTVTWYLRRLPAGMRAAAGNQDLLAYVRRLVATDHDDGGPAVRHSEAAEAL